MKLAMIQMRVEGGQVQANLERALDRVAEAARQGAAAVVLPEAFGPGWTDDSTAGMAEAIPEGGTFAALQAAARKHRIHVCAGLVERAGSEVFNAAVLLDPEGGLLLHHRKLNELEMAQNCYAQGSRLEVAHTTLGSIGLMICSDAFAPGQVISRCLGMMGAQIILSPCSWAVPADHDPARDPYGQLWVDNYAPVARDFEMWIVGVSNVGVLAGGPWRGRHCIGCSLAVAPDGSVARKGSYGVEADEILCVDADLRPRPARGDGWARLGSRRP